MCLHYSMCLQDKQLYDHLFIGHSYTDKIPSFNSLAPGKFEWNFRHVIFQQILVIDGWDIFSEIALIWMSLDFIDDQSTLIQVIAWCRLATSHYLSQCWPRSLSPYGVTRPQWVNKRAPGGHLHQSGAKPNLVANGSSQFHHLVNTGLVVGSLARWLSFTVAHICKLDTIWVVYISKIGNGSIWL